MTHAFVFPGQGSQSIGMLDALAAAEPTVRATFAEASAALGYDLWQLVSAGPEEALNSTERTQPALLAAGVAVWRVWRQHGGQQPICLAGHSLGEYTALVAADSLDLATAVKLVEFRGCAMRAAVPPGVGAMAAVLGLDDDAVRAACAESAADEVVADRLVLLHEAQWAFQGTYEEFLHSSHPEVLRFLHREPQEGTTP